MYNSKRSVLWSIDIIEKEFPVLHEVKYHLNEFIVTQDGILKELNRMRTLISNDEIEIEIQSDLRSVIYDLINVIDEMISLERKLSVL